MANFINSDFITTYEELLQLSKDLTKKWDPSTSSEADPGVVILKLLAMLSDRQFYRKDTAEAQAYLDTVTDRQAAFDLLQMLGYSLKNQKSATGYVELRSNLTGSDTETLPQFTNFSNADGTLTYFSVDSNLLQSQPSSVFIMEGSLFDIEKEGVNTFSIKDIDESGRLFLKKSNLARNGIFIGVDNGLGEYDFSRWGVIESTIIYPKGNYFLLLSDTTGENYIKFPSNYADLIGDSTFIIKATYSKGAAGNCPAGTITKVDASALANLNLTVRQYNDFISGEDNESISEGITNYYDSMQTFNTLVSSFDLNNAVKNLIVSADVNNSSDTQKLFSNSFTRTALDRQLQIISEDVNSHSFPYYSFDTSKPDRQLDLVCLKPSATYETGFEVIKASDNLNSNIKQQLDSSVCLLADPKIMPDASNFYIKAKTFLSGAVYANIESQVDANEILNKIIDTLKSKYKSENLRFGEELDYQGLIDIVKSCDPRILSTAISPLEYQVVKQTLSGETDVTDTDKKTIVTEAVLNGTIPLYNFKNRSNTDNITSLNPGYINSGFGMLSYDELDADEITISSFNNGAGQLVSALTDSSVDYKGTLYSTQLLQFLKTVKIAETDYGYGLYYYFYSPITQDIYINSSSSFNQGSLLFVGSQFEISGNPSQGGIFNSNYATWTQISEDLYEVQLIKNYTVTSQVTTQNGILKQGSALSDGSTLNGSAYNRPYIPSDTEYSLSPMQHLWIWNSAKTVNVDLTYPSVIQTSGVTIYSETSNVHPVASDNILNTSQTISVLVDDVSKISKNSNYFAILKSDSVTINSAGYILDEGEFFVYSNASLSEYIILGAGTILSSITDGEIKSVSSDASILSNITISYFTPLTFDITATATELSTYSDGYYIQGSSGDTDWNSSYFPASFSNLSRDITIKSSNTDSTFEKVFSADDNYKIRLVLYLKSDIDGQILFSKGTENTGCSIVLSYNGNTKTIDASSSLSNPNSLLCSEYISLIVDQNGIVLPKTSKYAAAKYSQNENIELISPTQLKIKFNSSTASENRSINIPNLTGTCLFKTNILRQDPAATISVSGGTLTRLSEYLDYQMYKFSITGTSPLASITLTTQSSTDIEVSLSMLSILDQAENQSYSNSVVYTKTQSGQALSNSSKDYYNPELNSLETDISGLSEGKFNWLNIPAGDLSHPTASINYFNSAHPWNYMTLPYIDMNLTYKFLKVLPISRRFK